MHLTLEVEGFDGRSAFKLTPIDRFSRGQRIKRIPVDAAGDICTRSRITHDGIALANGTTAANYEDDSGNTIHRRQTVAINSEGNPIRNHLATIGQAQSIQPIDPENLLNHIITAVYYLDPLSIHERLVLSLRDGQIFQVTFRPRMGTRNDPAFLIGNWDGLFLMQGRPFQAEMLTRETTHVPEDITQEEAPWNWDDLWDSEL